MKKIISLLAVAAGLHLSAKAQNIYTIAGNGTAGHSGDGGASCSAELSGITGMAVDDTGNVYFTEALNGYIRKITTSGIITTIAGTGGIGYNGDGGPASMASLTYPCGLKIDDSSNIYIADQSNNRIRKINTSGIITTVAGNGDMGYTGDGGPALSAALAQPPGIAMDAAGDMYIADEINSCIRKVNAAGVITTVISGLYYPRYIAVDSIGDVYYVFRYNVYEYSASGVSSVIAGNGTRGFSGDGGAAVLAQLNDPSGLALDGRGNLYIADFSNNRVRKIDAAGIITTVAGSGEYGAYGDGGAATSAQLDGPNAIAFDRSGNMYIADNGNNRIRMVGAPPPYLDSILAVKPLSPNTAAEGITVYPNPSSSRFIIEVPASSLPTSVVIMDMSGKTIQGKTLAPNATAKLSFDMGDASRDTYLIRATTGNKIYEDKVLVW